MTTRKQKRPSKSAIALVDDIVSATNYGSVDGVKSALRIDRLIAKERVRCLQILDASMQSGLVRDTEWVSWDALKEARERIRLP